MRRTRTSVTSRREGMMLWAATVAVARATPAPAANTEIERWCVTGRI